MRPVDLLALLRDFHADTRAQRDRHAASACMVRDYDVNNTYQYAVNREDAHLTWLREAIASCGGEVPEPPAATAARTTSADAEAVAAIVGEDARETQVLVERWQGRVNAVTNARQRRMLNVILGEMREHQRFFDQAAAGRTDMLGRRTAGSTSTGGVLPTRWIE